MMQTTPSEEQHLGVTEEASVMSPTAREAQRSETTRTGKYLCEVCRTTFEYESDSDDLTCPNCHNAKADLLTSLYMADDPQSSEMMSRDEFAAGD